MVPKRVRTFEKGLVHVYTGNGKGKTTTAMGLAFRAAGHGMDVLVIQFLKGGGYVGEMLAAEKLPNLRIVQFGKPCPRAKEIRDGLLDCSGCGLCFKLGPDDAARTKEALKFASIATSSGSYDLVVLDEVNVAMRKGMISVDPVINLVKRKHKNTELVLTGRGAPDEVIALADLVTEMRDVKHYMEKGVLARRGIEY